MNFNLKKSDFYRSFFAVKRATLAPAEQAFLLTSTAEPLHEMLSMKLPAELFPCREKQSKKTD
ncbi:MAG: hypothetical protein HUJ63_02380 [Enterococcus sp.]|nr:hypothetical protein [Enterococcus sp.]